MVNRSALGSVFFLGVILIGGCTTRQRVVPDLPLQSASLASLVDRLGERTRSIQTLKALVVIRPEGRPAVNGSLMLARSDEGGAAFFRLKGFDWLGRTLFDIGSDGDRIRIVVPSQDRVIEGRLDGLDDSGLPLPAAELRRLVSTVLGPYIGPDEIPVLEEQGRMYLIHLIRLPEGTPGKEGRLTRRLWIERTHMRLVRVELFGPAEITGTADLSGDGPRAVSAVEFEDYSIYAGRDGPRMAWPGRLILTRPAGQAGWAKRDGDLAGSRLILEFREVHLNPDIPPGEFRLP